ncbi:glycosyltransferase family 4 protein [Microbacterium sp. Marseille-Q6648]|uniref:glycosyltransferase family 4 protein n=1 Tax=Microbacterium sp. Marseille-Q6648 TaxID=2937991 RepID=UPI002557DA59|nr:glycosyltransferase family 4 protein [Microbacterium sp. Marseille-Q6648]
MTPPQVPRIVQIAPEIAPGSGIAGVAFDLERELAAAGVVVERFTMTEARGGRPLPSPRSRLAHAWDVVWFSTVGTARARRFLATRPEAVSICHNDAMIGDVYVNHGLLQASMRARGNYIWRMLRNPVHVFTAVRDRVRYRRGIHSAVVTLSAEETRRLTETYGRVAAPVTVIPNGVDLDRFRPPTAEERARARAGLGVDDETDVVVFIGHEFDRKGLPLVLDALADPGLTDVELVVIGGAPDEVRHGERLATHRGVASRVRFLGIRPDPAPLLWAADAFALPSAYESSGLVFLEALAAGLPVVASRVGVAPERIVDGRNGQLVERTGPDVARGLRTVLDGDRSAMRAEARASVTDLGWTGIAERYLDLATRLASAADYVRRDDAPLRIVHAVRSDGFSGVERYIAQLARAQAEAGHRVRVIGGDPARMRAALAGTGIGIPHRAARTTAGVARALRPARHDADVVNTHMTAADLGAVLAFAGRRRRPAVVSTRHFARSRGTVGPLPWDRVVSLVVDRELAISQAVAGTTGVQARVVRTGLDAAAPTLDEAVTPRAPVVLMAQRLQPEKHTGDGIRAFAGSGLAADGWTLRIAGDGPERAMLEELARDLGIGRSVEFLGYRTDVPALMAAASLLLAPCPVEGLGLTVLEALRAGLPVVAARGGGHVEVLDGLSPHALYDPDDAVAGGSALRALAHDPSAWSAYAEGARARQRSEYSLTAQVMGTDAVYRDALAGRHPRSGVRRRP